MTIRDLEVSINYLGCLSFDKRISESIFRQQVMVDLYPSCRTSNRLAEMAQELVGIVKTARPKGTFQFFWEHLLSRV
jgi:flagellar biosynthesis protein FlhG